MKTAAARLLLFLILQLGNSTVVSAQNYHATILHPAGTFRSTANAAGGTNQVGIVQIAPNNSSATHAALWNGAALSFIDLNPAGFLSSQAFGASGDSQVGDGIGADGVNHPLLWSGTAASAIDLLPTNEYENGGAYGVSETHQVGYAVTVPGAHGGQRHAMMWSGSAASATDLHPAAGYLSSGALGVDSMGNIVGYAQTEFDTFAVLWSPTVIPEPSGCIACIAVVCALNCRKTRYRRRAADAVPPSNPISSGKQSEARSWGG